MSKVILSKIFNCKIIWISPKIGTLKLFIRYSFFIESNKNNNSTWMREKNSMLYLEHNPTNSIINYTIIEIFPTLYTSFECWRIRSYLLRIVAFERRRKKKKGKGYIYIYIKKGNGKRYTEARVQRQSRIIKKAMEG